MLYSYATKAWVTYSELEANKTDRLRCSIAGSLEL